MPSPAAYIFGDDRSTSSIGVGAAELNAGEVNPPIVCGCCRANLNFDTLDGFGGWTAVSGSDATDGDSGRGWLVRASDAGDLVGSR